MPAQQYLVPGVTIAHRFALIPTSTVSALIPCVIGPRYQLFRYSDAAERQTIALGAYNPDDATDYAYPSQPSGSSVDIGYVKVYAENVWARYAQLSSSAANPVCVLSDLAPNKLRAAPLIGAGEEGKFGDAADAVATNGVFMQVGGFYFGGMALPGSYYLYPTGGTVAGAWSSAGLLSTLNEFGGGDAESGRLAWRTSSGQFGSTLVEASEAPLTSGTKIQGPHGLVFDFDAVDHDATRDAAPRRAARVSYSASTGVPVDGDTIVIGSRTFEFDDNDSITGGRTAVDISGALDVQDAIQALKIAVDEAIEAGDLTSVVEALHFQSDDDTGYLLLIGDSSFAATSTALWQDTDPVIVTPAAHNSWLAPRTLRIASASGSSYFTISLRPSAVKGVADAALDNGTLLAVSLTRSNVSAVSVDFDADAALLSVEWYPSAHGLDDVRDALVADADVTDRFIISAITGTTTADAATIADGTGSGLADAVAYVIMRDFYRVRLSANPYVFKTGNGTSHTSQFLTRGVRVGDRVRAAYTDLDGEPQVLDTVISGIEADQTIAGILPAAVGSENAPAQDGDIVAHGTGLAVMVPGEDNQRSMDGANTGVFALHPDAQAYPGRLATGVGAESYQLTITTGGAPGTARGTVVAVRAGTVRTGVRISYNQNGDTTEAVVYLGDNLWAVLDKGDGDADMVFQAGDSYAFSRDVDAPFVALSADDLAVSGDYLGTKNTTYRIEVIRGGVFEREAVVMDGPLSANQATLTYTGQPSNADTITVGDMVFEFRSSGSPTAGRAAVTIGGSADDTYAALVLAINASAVRAVAQQDTDAGTVLVQGAYGVIDACDESAANVTLAVESAELTAELDWSADVDDEYILTCVQEGALGSAVFSLSSERGDAATGVQFAGSGEERAIGSQGLTCAVTTSGSPTFKIGQSWVIRVYGTRPQVQVTDSAGSDRQVTTVVAADTPIALGEGGIYLTVSGNRNTHGGLCSAGGLRKGDVVHVEATAVGAGPSVVLVLKDRLAVDGLVPGLAADDQSDASTANDWTANYEPTRVALDLFIVQATTQIDDKRTQSAPDLNFEATADAVTVLDGLEVQDATWVDSNGDKPWLTVVDASLFLEYRALIPGDGIYELSGDVDGVSAALGQVHPDNPLALGVFLALTNAASRLVRYSAVPTDDLAGYESVLSSLGRTSKVYALAPMSSDSAIIDAVTGHVSAMSTSTKKRWRIAFISVAADALAPVHTAATNEGTDWAATITRYAGDGAGVYRMITVSAGEPQLLSLVSPGDQVRYAFGTDAYGDVTYATGTVERVLTNTTLLLVTALTAPVSSAAKIEIHHPRTGQELAAANSGISESFSSYRVYNVLPGMLYSGTEARPGMFAAAALAGLVGSVSPQQPLTNHEVQGFTDVPSTYRTWTDTDLDTMAAGGALLVVQDERDGPVYIRHQLSTATGDGNLLTRELSVIKNLDAIMYYLDAALLPLTGKMNATQVALALVGTVLRNALAFLTSDRSMGSANSPMLLSVDADGKKTEVTALRFHPTARDRCSSSLHLNMPVPLNGIDVDIEAG